jgi:hypothetical protein
MNSATVASSSEANVNYDEAPIVQQEIDGIDYRLDTGHGSAVAISQRPAGSWDWELMGEGKWDGSRLKAKMLDFALAAELGKALSVAMKERNDGGGWG